MDQMVECEFCGTEVSGGSAFTCTYCRGTFCPAHRLPFNHACPNIEEWRNSKPSTKKVAKQTAGSGVLTDQKGLVAGGMLMLALIIVFLLLFRVL
ncbi:MAG TPA: AN1-type zinc finger domain-containing protein [Methanospirillum sp.]|uniref:AN1-type zinc finger domain-containing protein n=1 Tax=Methanospirillum sp. TaxID=45200 RepID=UPI002B8FE472|nr:AN1-type zinc finger domain-containing protein [Methanospirillum sp.]HWQ64692.1 AN1-type zinc finger domain-containing protein [Methanospirillum sp.]